MKAFVLIRQGGGRPILPEFEISRGTGQMVETQLRDPQYVEVPELDENGDPTGETRQQFTGWGPLYDTQVEKRIGGYGCIGTVGNWGAYIVYGSPQMLQELDAQPGVVGISAKKDLNKQVKAAVRTKLNTWLSNHGYPNIPASWTNRRVIKGIFKEFFPDYNLRMFDVGKDDPDEEEIVLDAA